MEYELVMWNILIQTASSYTILEPYLKLNKDQLVQAIAEPQSCT